MPLYKNGSSGFRAGWIEIQSSTREVDCGLEVLDVAEAVGSLLDPLDRGIDRFLPRVREPMRQVRQHVRKMPSDQLGDLGHRPEPAVRSAPEPARKEVLGGPLVGTVPELAEALLEGPSPCHLEIAALQGAKRGPLLGRHVLGAHEPETLGPCQPVIPRLLQSPMLRAADPVHGHVQVFGHVELVEDDLSRCPIEGGLGRLDIGPPHVHRDGFNPSSLLRRQRAPEAI